MEYVCACNVSKVVLIEPWNDLGGVRCTARTDRIGSGVFELACVLDGFCVAFGHHAGCW
jgi:hypothetical protein